jgi:hypothetical protein
MSGIRTHDPSLRASEDSAYIRRLGYRDRPDLFTYLNYVYWSKYPIGAHPS